MRFSTDNNGLQLEYNVGRILASLDTDWFRFVSNVLFLNKNTGRTSQIDHVVVSPYGLFVIECKSYNGKLEGRDTQTYWQYTHNDSGNQYKVYSATAQNYTHIKTLESVLSDYYPLPSTSLIVFSDNTDFTNLYCKKSIPLHVSELRDFLESQNTLIYLLGAVEDIMRILSDSRLRGKEVQDLHNRQVKDTLRSISLGGDFNGF